MLIILFSHFLFHGLFPICLSICQQFIYLQPIYKLSINYTYTNKSIFQLSSIKHLSPITYFLSICVSVHYLSFSHISPIIYFLFIFYSSINQSTCIFSFNKVSKLAILLSTITYLSSIYLSISVSTIYQPLHHLLTIYLLLKLWAKPRMKSRVTEQQNAVI